MLKMVLSFGIIIAGVFAGQILRKWHSTKDVVSKKKIEKTTNTIRVVAFFVLNPIIMVNSYWVIDFSNISIFMLPLICVLVLALNGGIGLLVSKKLKHSCEQRSAMFAGSTFSNLGTIGGLITFSFFGEKAFAIAAMFILFESFYNYLLAYPIVKSLGEGQKGLQGRIKDLLKDPSIIVYVSAVFVGVALNISPLSRPQFMSLYNEYMIPIVSFLLIGTIAFTMDLGKTKTFFKEGIAIICLKFLVAPVIGVSLALLFGLQDIEQGLVVKVVAIMTLVPCGFNAIVVPTVYKADRDVANTVWMFSMLALAIVVPLEYLFFFVL